MNIINYSLILLIHHFHIIIINKTEIINFN